MDLLQRMTGESRGWQLKSNETKPVLQSKSNLIQKDYKEEEEVDGLFQEQSVQLVNPIC